MKITITRRFLVFPVNTIASQKKLTFCEAGNLLYDLDIKLDNNHPCFWAFVDVSRFMGKTLDVEVSPEMTLTYEEADSMEMEGLWQERLRPQVHFTVKNGWNNDPNGLIYYEGKYHMFYQYNPCEPQWNNMHWGHAVSDDLIHWEEKDIALYPDKLGTMYSGSAIEDINNVSGLGEDGKAPMLLYYTAAGNHGIMSKGKRATQCLAYSTDGGKTFEKYEGNPIVAHIEAGNRDPKVVWVDEISRFIMVIYLDDDRYLMLESTDLLHFKEYQKISLRSDAECPDLFALYWNGRKHWVLVGASDIYVIGQFTEHGFVTESSENRLSYTNTSYAAQSFSGMPDGKAVRIWWDRLDIPKDGRFSQQMSIPTQMSLEKVNDKMYLCAQPVQELETLRKGGEAENDIMLENVKQLHTGNHPVDLLLEMPFDDTAVLIFDIFGTKLTCDMTCNQIRFKNVRMPISAECKKVTLRMVIDRCSVEVFADGGKFCFTGAFICDDNLPRIILEADHEVKIDKLEWYELESIHG